MTVESSYFKILQNGHADKLELVNIKEDVYKWRLVQQQAGVVHLSSIWQAEATFDVSIAAQAIDYDEDDANKLNEFIAWQKNKQRELAYIGLDLPTLTLKMFTMVDECFANLTRLNSLIGFIVIILNEIISDGTTSFKLYGYLVHWSSTKGKCFTRNILASEIYRMVGCVDL